MANEKRMIDAKPLIEDGWHLVKTGESNRFLQSMSLADAPTVDAVEVVRCKDCKHWRENTLWCDMNSRDRETWHNWYEDDFCSYGERRTDV